jgi:hypothetical protein
MAIDVLFYMKMMFVPHWKHRPPLPGNGDSFLAYENYTLYGENAERYYIKANGAYKNRWASNG